MNPLEQYEITNASTHVKLSKILHKFSKFKNDTKMLTRIHNSNCARLGQLTKLDKSRADEYLLLHKYVVKEQSSTKYLIAVEYEFDDGGREQGHGDAIFFDGTIYVTECKITNKNNSYTEKRENDVINQAEKYKNRLASWLHHLGKTDAHIYDLCKHDIIAAVITSHQKFEILKDRE